MDVAYDHIQEEVLSPDEASGKEQTGTEEAPPTLNTEFAEAYKAISATPWGARFGSFVGNVRKQGETYYEGARQEYTAASSQASKGFNQIMDRTRSLSLKQPESTAPTSSAADASQQGDSTSSDSTSRGPPRSASEALQDSDGIIFRFRTEATKRLKDIEKAEDAADEALLKFGTNIRNFFREAIAIAPPAAGEGAVDENGKSTVLFESKDRDGKRVIHTTRFDAQLHVIHSTRDGFLNDPVSAEYSSWKEGFEVEKQTEAISKDLEKFEELRAAMAHLVPDQVRYEDFWARYYFLRHVVETEEQKRREMLRGASLGGEEEVDWDDDSGPENGPTKSTEHSAVAKSPASMNSSSTLHPTSGTGEGATTSEASLKPPNAPRRSNDQQSQPDSDASYDLVSGATSGVPSHAPGSPREARKPNNAEDSDEDWE